MRHGCVIFAVRSASKLCLGNAESVCVECFVTIQKTFVCVSLHEETEPYLCVLECVFLAVKKSLVQCASFVETNTVVRS